MLAMKSRKRWRSRNLLERLHHAVDAIVGARENAPPDRAILAGISGIDGSGKGYITALLENRLRKLSHNVASISADDWLNLPDVCMPHHALKSGAMTPRTPKALRAKHFASAFGVRRAPASLSHEFAALNGNDPGEHFYKNALRLDEMFERLILPLRDKREVDVVADCGDPKAIVHRKHHYVFDRIDIVLLEGIFLFKREYRDQFDLKVWVDCSFETALRRAIARGQEGLPPEETRRAFETIYFPAQRIHLARDCPVDAVDLILANDTAPGVATQCPRGELQAATRFVRENKQTTKAKQRLR